MATPAPTPTPTPPTLGTRSVDRLIEPGSNVHCAGCDQHLKFVARRKLRQIICNVYKRRRWDRVEHWHPDCYTAAGEPHGTPAR